MILEQINFFISGILSLGLVATAAVKNYHFEKFCAIKFKEKIDPIQLTLRIMGGSIVGMVWIIPFSITDTSPNAEAQKHKDMFNKTSRYFHYFWSALIVYILLYIIVNHYHTA